MLDFELQDVAVTADLFGHSAGRLHKVGKAAIVEYNYFGECIENILCSDQLLFSITQGHFKVKY